MTQAHPESWEEVARLVDDGDAAGLRRLWESLPSEETARTLSRLDDTRKETLLQLIGPEESAEVIGRFSDTLAADILEGMTAEYAAAIVDELPSAEQADVLGEMSDSDAAAVLSEMSPDEAHDAHRLLQYEAHVAGGLMITEFLAYRLPMTVGQVADDLTSNRDRYRDYDIQYIYVTEDGGRLAGVLRLRDLLLVTPEQPIASIMIRSPLSVRVDTSLQALRGEFRDHDFLGVPVVDEHGALVGVVRRAAVEQALQEEATETYLKIAGITGDDELRSMPLHRRARRRLSWLSINIALNIVAASVIALYQDTIAAVIALAVFLPIISDMSGCSGNQAVAVSIRELSLGLLKPYEFLRVIGKEGGVGLINGLVLGTLLGTAAALWQANVYLGVVVGGALMINTVLAVLLGGLIPLGLRALKVDPALASGPILTTVTDMVGFLTVLAFATAMLPLLTG